nr:hypothetical protein BaRGS_020810 [Batillaria attramentaria]
MVQHAALLSFTGFAEQTAYEAVVPECLAQKQGLQEKVTAFLQKYGFETAVKDLESVVVKMEKLKQAAEYGNMQTGSRVTVRFTLGAYHA